GSPRPSCFHNGATGWPKSPGRAGRISTWASTRLRGGDPGGREAMGGTSRRRNGGTRTPHVGLWSRRSGRGAAHPVGGTRSKRRKTPGTGGRGRFGQNQGRGRRPRRGG